MSDTSDSAQAADVPPSRWSLALTAEGVARQDALRELLGSYWYCLYAWWRRAGLEAEEATAATLACFTRWVGDSPPAVEDAGAARMREWVPARLAAMADEAVEIDEPSAL